ncbi:MAG: YncE family protein [Terriglobia bacterium]
MAGIASWLLLVASAGLMFPLWAAAPPGASPSRGLLLVANKGEHTLGIVDPAEGKQLAVITLTGVTGHEVAASPDGRFAYVPIYGNSGVGQPGSNGDSIDVIDVHSRRLLKKVTLERAVRPHCAVYGPDGLLYVTAELADAIYVMDPHTMKRVGSISTEQKESHMLTISSDGKRGYTANVGAGSVTALDLVRRRPITVIHVSKQVQRISITPDNRWVFTADQTAPRLAVIDTESNKLSSWIPLPAVAFGTRVTLDGRWLLATLPGEDKIAVIDLKSMRLARTIDVPKAPQEILMRPDGQAAFISCDSSHEVAVLNLGNWQVEKLIHVGRGDDGLAWAPVQ